MLKKLLTLTLSLVLFSSFALPTFAQTVDPCPKNAGQGLSNLCDIGVDNIGPFIQNIITFLFVIAVIVATFFLIYGGIKWISSGGDKSAVEGARNIIIAAVVGLVVTFATYLILNIVMSVFGLNDVGEFKIPTLKL